MEAIEGDLSQGGAQRQDVDDSPASESNADPAIQKFHERVGSNRFGESGTDLVQIVLRTSKTRPI